MGNVDEGIRRQDIRGRVQVLQCLHKGKMPELLCKVLLQRRMRGKFLQFPWYDSATLMIIGCELQRKRVECAIMIKAALADKEEN